jgi:hypothetical protein
MNSLKKQQKSLLDSCEQITKQIVKNYVDSIDKYIKDYMLEYSLNIKQITRLSIDSSINEHIDLFVDNKNEAIFLKVVNKPFENIFSIQKIKEPLSEEFKIMMRKNYNTPKLEWIDCDYSSFVLLQNKKVLEIIWNSNLFGDYWSIRVLNLFEKNADNLIFTERNSVKLIAENELNKVKKEL